MWQNPVNLIVYALQCRTYTVSCFGWLRAVAAAVAAATGADTEVVSIADDKFSDWLKSEFLITLRASCHFSLRSGTDSVHLLYVLWPYQSPVTRRSGRSRSTTPSRTPKRLVEGGLRYG